VKEREERKRTLSGIQGREKERLLVYFRGNITYFPDLFLSLNTDSLLDLRQKKKKKRNMDTANSFFQTPSEGSA
jgi:hypothetical protein